MIKSSQPWIAKSSLITHSSTLVTFEHSFKKKNHDKI